MELVSFNTILTAVGVGLGIVALANSIRPSGSGDVSESVPDVSTSNQKQIAGINSQIQGIFNEIQKAADFLQQGANIGKGVFTGPSARAVIASGVPSNNPAVNTQALQAINVENLGLGFQNSGIIEELTSFISQGKSQIDLLKTKRDSL